MWIKPRYKLYYVSEVMFLKIQWKKLLVCIAIPLIVGGIAAWFTMKSMETFENIKKPPLSPPGWLFPIVWTILYTLMGIASYIVLASDKKYRAQTALTVYGIQLAFNFLWTIIFFNTGIYWFAFVWLLALWILVVITAVLFYRISAVSGYWLIPYVLWVTFAAYLNFAIALLN